MQNVVWCQNNIKSKKHHLLVLINKIHTSSNHHLLCSNFIYTLMNMTPDVVVYFHYSLLHSAHICNVCVLVAMTGYFTFTIFDYVMPKMIVLFITKLRIINVLITLMIIKIILNSMPRL